MAKRSAGDIFDYSEDLDFFAFSANYLDIVLPLPTPARPFSLSDALGSPLAVGALTAPSGDWGAANLDQPQSNGSLATTLSVPASGDQRIDGILAGVRWSGSITYSDPDSAADYQAGYYTDGNGNGISAQNEGFSQLSAQQMVAFHSALNEAIYTQPAGSSGFSVEGFTNLGITYGTSGTGTGTIRYANSSDPGTSYAFYPNNSIYGGDGFIGTSARTPTAGNYSWYTMFHELGHSLGLAHGHTGGAYGALPSNVDSMEYSVMTYRSYIGSDAQYVYNETWGYAQTYMMLDIAALQYMYGADFNSNSGNTTYTWSSTTGASYVNGVLAINPGGNRIFETVWDGNGIDTYDLSNYTTDLSIDLSPGGYSTFSSQQRAYLGGGPNGGYARGNVFNALQYNGDARSLIENAIGGSGNDTFAGNIANNSINGGIGTDSFIFAGNRSLFTFTESDGNSYVVNGNSQGTDSLSSIERFVFNDITVTDDRMGGVSTSGIISADNSNVTGEVQFSGDRDWFAVTLQAGHNYLINERGSPSGGGTLFDTYVRLHNSAGTVLAGDDDSGRGLESVLAVHVSTSGTYYVDGSAFGGGLGTYSLSVQEQGIASGIYPVPALVSGQFGSSFNAGGWENQHSNPRLLADVNGDGLADIVGFGYGGVSVALATYGGNFAQSTFELVAFGSGPNAGMWEDNNLNTRQLGDVNHDGLADIVGFGYGGMVVSLATGNGHFAAQTQERAVFGTGPSAGGWESYDAYPRVLGDVNGDGLADAVGFSYAGVVVSLATGGGHFGAQTFELSAFGAAPSAGGWSTNNDYPRLLADVNGDGRADIVGFGYNGVTVSLATGGGHFAAQTSELAAFGAGASAGGWDNNDLYPRMLADVNADGRADIVGFGYGGVTVALATGGGHFAVQTFEGAEFGAGPNAGNWTSADLYPRMLGDITGDHRADIVGFSFAGTVISQSHDFLIV